LPPNRPIRRTLPRQPLRLRHSLASRAVNGRALTRLPHNKVHAETCGLVCNFRNSLPYRPQYMLAVVQPAKPNAANAATALRGTRPASCRGGSAPAAPPPPHLPPPGKPFGLPQVATMPSCPGHASTACHLLSFFQLFAFHCLSCRVIWTLVPCANRS